MRDLCRLMESILLKKPAEYILNAGNNEMIPVKDWVTLCYSCLGKVPEFATVNGDTEQRQYFSFYDYEYCLDVSRQQKLLPQTIPFREGLMESFHWYIAHQDEVEKRPYISFID